jgi:hypothetical protein
VPGTQSIREHGWRQGSVLPDEVAARLATPRFEDWGKDDRAILLSQDCDVVHGSYEAEPTVELIRAKVAAVEDALARHGRNPRRLQLEMSDGVFINFSIHDRWATPRSELEGCSPESTFAVRGESLQILVEWVAKRYTRPAFPDAFNDRRASATRKIEKELKKSGKLITGLFLAILPDGECPDDQSYSVALRVTAAKETLVAKAIEADLVRSTRLIAEALGACDGIEVVDHALVSEAAFTLADLRYFRRWDWDYRSHSGEPGGEIAPTP